MSITITRRFARQIDLHVPKIGYVQLYGEDGDWSIVTFGRGYPTVEECLAYLETVVANWDKPSSAPECPFPDPHYAAQYAYACGYYD